VFPIFTLKPFFLLAFGFDILACPARFERATYALEEFVAARMSIYFNSLQRKNGTV
jgi:hypothetical protein